MFPNVKQLRQTMKKVKAIFQFEGVPKLSTTDPNSDYKDFKARILEIGAQTNIIMKVRCSLLLKNFRLGILEVELHSAENGHLKVHSIGLIGQWSMITFQTTRVWT